MLRQANRASALSALVLFTPLKPASANIFSDAWKVITDPFKLNSTSQEVSSSLYRTMIQANQLETQGNNDAKDRLAQLQGIVDGALSGSAALESKAAQDMKDIEKGTNEDAAKTIKCGAATTVTSLEGAWATMRKSAQGMNMRDFGVASGDFERVAIMAFHSADSISAHSRLNQRAKSSHLRVCGLIALVCFGS